MNWFERYSQYQRVRFSAADSALVSIVADAVFSIYWPMTSDAYGR